MTGESIPDATAHVGSRQRRLDHQRKRMRAAGPRPKTPDELWQGAVHTATDLAACRLGRVSRCRCRSCRPGDGSSPPRSRP
jgi:hypothetical protein